MISKKKVYISGPMTGYPMKNKELFDLAEAYLQDKGYEVVNPAAKTNEILNRDATEEEYLSFMAQDIFEILYKDGGVDEIYVLPKWHESKGAIFEVSVAAFFKIPIHGIKMEDLNEFKRRRYNIQCSIDLEDLNEFKSRCNEIRRRKKKLASIAVERIRRGGGSGGIWGEEVRRL